MKNQFSSSLRTLQNTEVIYAARAIGASFGSILCVRVTFAVLRAAALRIRRVRPTVCCSIVAFFDGFSFATSILGFLVAGFTVFVTVIRIDMFLTMARTEKANTGESVLKYNLSAFIVTFVHYTSYIFVCLMSELFLQPGGLATVAFANAQTYPNLAPWAPLAHSLGATALLVTFGAWTAYLVLLLKSFIYNVYQVTTVSVAYAWQEADKPEPPLDAP